MPKITIFVGPPGSGKSTFAKEVLKENPEYHAIDKIYINQDLQGKEHLNIFQSAIKHKLHIVVDRMNFDKNQRARYLNPAKEAGYETEIIVLHESLETCLKRCNERTDHPNIRDEVTARKVLDFFFSHYERPTLDEADHVEYRYPELTMKLNTVIVDLDGTLCDTSHRQHHVQGEGKKDWKSFFDGMDKDPIHKWCNTIIKSLRQNSIITLCSGRPDNFRATTKKWLEDNQVFYDNLYMRPRNDSRADTIIKEIILDFEIKTRYSDILFAIDDRQCIVDMWRSRGITCLQCDVGDF